MWCAVVDMVSMSRKVNDLFCDIQSLLNLQLEKFAALESAYKNDSTCTTSGAWSRQSSDPSQPPDSQGGNNGIFKGQYEIPKC